MTVTINKNDYERILAHARENLPEEACGLIAGIDREDGVREIKKVYLLTNIDHTNEHFSIDPKDQLASIKTEQYRLIPGRTTGSFVQNQIFLSQIIAHTGAADKDADRHPIFKGEHIIDKCFFVVF